MQLRMTEFQCLLFVLKQSYIHYYIICMTVLIGSDNSLTGYEQLSY